MLSRIAVRSARYAPRLNKNFSTSSVRAGGYHYPEGPRSNIPFSPLTRFFGVRYFLFCVTGFGLPFGIAVWQVKKKDLL